MNLRIVAFAGLIALAANAVLRSEDLAEQTAAVTSSENTPNEEPADLMRQMQEDAIKNLKAEWGYWGNAPDRYSTWMNHSNRLIPIYTFGLTLDALRNEGSVYTDEQRLKELYGIVPDGTLQKEASYFDQTDVYRLQLQAIAAGKTQIILIVFDGMDWDSTYNAALYKNGSVSYTEGRGTGLAFQDYRGVETDFGYVVTSARLAGARTDVNAQVVLDVGKQATGGFDPSLGGAAPWVKPAHKEYLMGLYPDRSHTVTDSASSATSMNAGIKTYNDAINVDAHGTQVETIAHQLQRDRNFAIGVVSSVPISHATPAAAYAHNVSRDDYQDLTRDLIGLPSVAHKRDPLLGVDVLIGCGWEKAKDSDAKQGENFVPGHEYYDANDLQRVSIEQGGKYVLTQRTAGRIGTEVLDEATETAIAGKHRLLGVFGASDGHLPFATADGKFDPTMDVRGQAKYRPEDVIENPLLADMAVSALKVLRQNNNGFWLMIEAGDVDWANHANSIDNSIGAVLSGDAAVKVVFDWIERESDWAKTAVIVTADHGHYFVLTDPEAIAKAGAANAKP